MGNKGSKGSKGKQDARVTDHDRAVVSDCAFACFAHSRPEDGCSRLSPSLGVAYRAIREGMSMCVVCVFVDRMG